jgi:hypothetical protein
MVASLPLITNDELRMTSWVVVASLLLITNDKLRMTNLVAEALEARFGIWRLRRIFHVGIFFL